jgi:hypothetical protein
MRERPAVGDIAVGAQHDFFAVEAFFFELVALGCDFVVFGGA